MRLFNKGQIGSTLTWFIAVLVLLFMMVVYLGAVISLATERKLFFYENDLGIEESSVNDLSMTVINSLLQQETDFEGKKAKIKDLILLAESSQEAKKTILEQVKKLDRRYPGSGCIGFSARTFDKIGNPNSKPFIAYSRGVSIGQDLSDPHESKEFNYYEDQSVKIMIYDEKKIIINFYLGDIGGSKC